MEQQLRKCFSLGEHRTPYQDALYSLQQLVEIAAHALSPGINEPFTAITCIDWLGASLRGVLGRPWPLPARHDERGKLRVVTRELKFDEFTDAAFNQIRIYGANNPDIMIRLLSCVAGLASAVRRAEEGASLLRHACLVAADASQIKNETDREQVMESFQKTLQALQGTHPESTLSHGA